MSQVLSPTLKSFEGVIDKISWHIVFLRISVNEGVFIYELRLPGDKRPTMPDKKKRKIPKKIIRPCFRAQR